MKKELRGSRKPTIKMLDFKKILKSEQTLDPDNWDEMKALSVRMVEDMFDYLKNIRERNVWQKTPKKVKKNLDKPLPEASEEIEEIYQDFKDNILPYNKGNVHPRFWSWVQGTGTPFAMMAEMLSAGLNPDVCTGDHAPMYVEEQVIDWFKTIMEFPDEASGVLVSGTSMANLTGLLIARDACTNQQVREAGLHLYSRQLVLYASSETHSCIAKAADIMGLGKNAVRIISVDAEYKMDVEELQRKISDDKKNGLLPFCVVANVGTVNTGAIDPLQEIMAVCKKESLWLHIDGAFGAFAKLVPEYKDVLKLIGKADSLAFDLHKWMSMPFGTGCLLVRDRDLHRQAFSMQPNYLAVHERGVASGPEPIFNYGIEMTRGFRALKIWMTLKEQGIEKISSLIRQNIAQAFYLESLVKQQRLLELVTPVTMNIVCFRFNPGNDMNDERLNKLNKEILMELQEKGIASMSHTILNDQYVFRVANVNHRSRKEDFDLLVNSVVALGKTLKSIF